MKDGLKTFGVIILVMIGVGLLTFVGNGIATGNYAFWAPKQQRVEYNVFKNSPSYIQGFNRELATDYQQYQLAPDSTKLIMKNIIIVKYAKYNTSDIEDPILQGWFLKLRGF